MHAKSRTAHLAIDLLIVFVALLHLLPFAGIDVSPDADAGANRVCFPAASWDEQYGVPDAKRPCVRIERVQEDGSFNAAVLDADGTERYNLGVGVPNRYER